MNPLSVRCPHCKAVYNEHCSIPGYRGRRPEGGYHPSRIEALSAFIKREGKTD